MADIKLLMVCDGDRFNYGPAQVGDDETNFALTALIAALENSTVPSIQVDKAHRRGEHKLPGGSQDTTQGVTVPGDFVFSDASLAGYDVVWILGDEGKNGGDDLMGATSITADERAALANFMEHGGGVFATGDHDGVGSRLGAEIIRVRLMRRWYEAEDAPNYNGQNIAGNWAGNTNAAPPFERNDTLLPDGDGSGLTYFDDQADPQPQTLMQQDGSPLGSREVHAILRDRIGALIERFPDHMHEGEATDFSIIGKDAAYQPNDGMGNPHHLNVGGTDFVEFKKVGGVQPVPQVICWGRDSGHETIYKGFTYSQTMEKITAKVAVYDGRAVNVGRIVTGSTFHHYIDKNLIGDPGTATNPPTNTDQGLPAGVLQQMDDYFVNVATWLAPQNPSFHFITNKNSFGLDEANNTPTGWDQAFYLAVDGFTPAALMGASFTLGGPFDAAANISAPGALIHNGDTAMVQRVLVPFKVNSIPPASFPSTGQPPKLLVLGAETTIQGRFFFAEAVFELLPGADPYFSNVDPSVHQHWYLSRDLRVLQVCPGVTAIPFGLTSPAGGSHYTFVQELITHLNANYSDASGTDPFDILPGIDTLNACSSVDPMRDGHENFNYAIARVRLKGTTGTVASDVRVFFRLYETQSNDTDYDPVATYPSHLDASHLPDRPLAGQNNMTTPMTATGSVNSDYPGPNQRDLTANGAEKWAWYACYLNVYNNPPVQLIGTHHCLVAQIACDDAPIVSGSGVTLSPENCDKLAQRNMNVTPSGNPGGPDAHLVPMTFEVRPSLRTGEKAGTLNGYPDELMIDWGQVPRGSTATVYWPGAKAIDIARLHMMLHSNDEWRVVDESTVECTVKSRISYLPIPFGAGASLAGLFTIELPLGVRAGQRFDVVVRRIGTRRQQYIGIKQQDTRTFARGDLVARRPMGFVKPPMAPPDAIPSARGKDRTEHAAARHARKHARHEEVVEAVEATAAAAAQTTVDRGKERFERNWRYFVGTFQITIPVKLEEDLLWAEENTLAIMKWRLTQTAYNNRWYPVLVRYVEYLSRRVDAFGGEASNIKPYPCGVLRRPICPPHGRGGGGGGGDGGLGPCGAGGDRDVIEMTGKVSEVLYNCFGEFEGFVLRSCSSSHGFVSCEKGIGELVMRACHDRLTLSVFVERAGEHRIRRVAVKCC